MMPLNAVDEPMLTSARAHAIRVVAATEYTGIEVLELIYFVLSATSSTFTGPKSHFAQSAPPRKSFVTRERPENSRRGG